jgi:hypothetical protein
VEIQGAEGTTFVEGDVYAVGRQDGMVVRADLRDISELYDAAQKEDLNWFEKIIGRNLGAQPDYEENWAEVTRGLRGDGVFVNLTGHDLDFTLPDSYTEFEVVDENGNPIDSFHIGEVVEINESGILTEDGLIEGEVFAYKEEGGDTYRLDLREPEKVYDTSTGQMRLRVSKVNTVVAPSTTSTAPAASSSPSPGRVASPSSTSTSPTATSSSPPITTDPGRSRSIPQ